MLCVHSFLDYKEMTTEKYQILKVDGWMDGQIGV